MGNVFLSYRRADSGAICGRIADSLRGVFGANAVFRDVSAIPGGIDFRQSVESALSQSQVVVALIGPTWATATDDQGRRRLDNPDDPVRIEIESALVRRIPIIPVLVLGGRMPPAQVLPPSIAQLSFLNAYEIHDDPLYQAGIQRVIEGVAYFIPLLPTDQSRLQQQANAAFVQAQQVGKQVAPIVKTAWTGGMIALAVFSVLFACSGIGMFFAAHAFGNVAATMTGTGFNNDPTAQSFQAYFNTLVLIIQGLSIGFAVLGVVLGITAIRLLRRGSRRRSAAA